MTHDDLFKLMKEIDPRTERVPTWVQRLADALEARFSVQLAAKQAQIDHLNHVNEISEGALNDEIHCLKGQVVKLEAKFQAQIDALKLEYCPNEVLPQFLIDEIKHQLVTMDMCDTRFKD